VFLVLDVDIDRDGDFGVPEEKRKPFRLVKYFTFSSLVVMFAGTVVLAMLNTHWTRSLQRKNSEAFAQLLIENLNHQIFLQFILPVALKYGKIQLREKEQFERMDKVVRSTLHSFHVEMVNIYDMKNIVSYSFNHDLIGNMDLGGSAYQTALEGKTTSRLVQRGNFFQLLLGFPKESRLITFAPLRAEQPLAPISGPVLGVIEIIQDLSGEYRTIFDFQMLVIGTGTGVMGLLFVVLIFVVKRGEGIIQARAQERMRLKEELSRARHLSSIGEMVAGVSHEIRNPLGIIRSSAELLKKKMAAIDPGNRVPDIIVEEAGRLNLIVSDFLSYARPRQPHPVPCRVSTVLEKTLDFLTPQLEESRCRIQRQLPESLPESLADPDMLHQAFLNILINAMQAMPDGGDLVVSAAVQTQAVVVFFEDQGQGIAKDVMAKIWDPFFTTKTKGTGLGLGIVKKIIEAHGGHIRVENRPEAGVRVTVSLPIS
jgi:two-component system sensor histidine kinase HydH